MNTGGFSAILDEKSPGIESFTVEWHGLKSASVPRTV